jgi:hypothetical protein
MQESPRANDLLAAFHTVRITAPLDKLPASEQEAVRHLVDAAHLMDDIFLRQAYRRNLEVREELDRQNNPTLKTLFNIHYGPFNRIKGNEPFIPGHRKPKGATFYPEDMTKKEFESHLTNHPEDREAFESTHTLIERQEGTLIATPYNIAYHDLLEQAAASLRKAAAATMTPSLKRFLNLRAEAFETNEYEESERAWIDLDGPIEVTIGPYEVYEDELFGYKAAFEAFIGIVDQDATAQFKRIEASIPTLEKTIPHTTVIGKNRYNPITIVNEIMCAGDGRAGVQFTAYNLPNDEKIREEKGSKKVLIKNVSKAKYEHCWTPIIRRVMTPESGRKVSAQGAFTHTLLHEISHGLGPGTIVKNGRKTTVNKALKESYAVIEEAKADVLGVLIAQTLEEQGLLAPGTAETVAHSFIGGIFRSIRFGISEAHGGAGSIIYNYLEDEGAVELREGKVAVTEKVMDALANMANDILDIQARGDEEAARKLIAKHVDIKPHVSLLLELLEDLPVDIRPIFDTDEV